MPSRQTKRERKELARKQRLEAMRRSARRRRLRKIYGVVTVAAVAAAVFGLVWVFQWRARRETGKLKTLAAAAACTTLQKHPSEGPFAGENHLTPPAEFPYKTDPPSSGNHYGNLAQNGPSAQPLNDENFVHNLEHGNVGLLYKASVPDAIKQKLDDIATRDTSLYFSGVYEKLKAPIGFTAWQSTMTCLADAGKADAIAATARQFAKVAGKKGPEGFIPGSAR